MQSNIRILDIIQSPVYNSLIAIHNIPHCTTVLSIRTSPILSTTTQSKHCSTLTMFMYSVVFVLHFPFHAVYMSDSTTIQYSRRTATLYSSTTTLYSRRTATLYSTTTTLYSSTTTQYSSTTTYSTTIAHSSTVKNLVNITVDNGGSANADNTVVLVAGISGGVVVMIVFLVGVIIIVTRLICIKSQLKRYERIINM